MLYSHGMTTQADLDLNISSYEEALIFYRPVKSKKRLTEPEEEPIDTPSELKDVEELVEKIKSNKLDYPTPLNESGMQELRSDAVYRIIDDKTANHNAVRNLLGVFCDNLEGRQRAENKYAMLIYFGDGFLLAHVRAQRGMSIKEENNEIELIRRFLDIDNILSAALFEDKDGEIEFSHFTDSGSDSFRKFLGVNEHRLNYRRKNIQILCYYRSRREYKCKFEFSTDEFSDKWLRDGSISFRGDKLTFEEDGGDDRPHEIKEIRWGNDSYESVERFKSEFKQENLGLDIDRDKYDKLTSYPDESSSQRTVFDDDVDEAIDNRRSIELVSEEEREIIPKNEDTPDNTHVLYSGSHIRLNPSFADDIYHDFVKQNSIRIYHPASPAAAQALEIGQISFLNVREDSVSDERVELLSETYKHAINRAGETVSKMLINSMLQILRLEVTGPLSHALDQLVEIYTGNPPDGATISTKENEGPDLVEYKNKTHLSNGNSAQTVIKEVETEKRKGNSSKIFLWGFTEQNRRIEGFSSQSWGDDRISDIEGKVEEGLSENSINFERFMMQPVELDHSGSRKVIIGILF